MSIYARFDVSAKRTHICVVDTDGKVLRRDVVASDPADLAKWLNRHCAELGRAVLETGALSTFLCHGLVEHGVAVERICARLMSVPGAGPITAVTFTATIEDPRRFTRSYDIGAYAGLVPRRSQSGARDTSGHTSKGGDSMLRRRFTRPPTSRHLR